MIKLCVPNLGPKEAEYVAQALASNWVGPAGPFVERFEALVAKAAKREWAVATITGSAALHAAALALGFGFKQIDVPRDVFPAMRNVLANLDAKIRFVAGGQNHDEQRYVNGRGPALCDRAPAIGELPFDAALECYSFAANKIATCGHGGAIVGDESPLEQYLRQMIRQGYGRTGVFNYRMANLNAAIGCAQMERLDELKDAKRRIWNRYAESLPMIDRGPSRWMATVDLPHALVGRLEVQGIESRAEPSGGVSLPCSTDLSIEDQDRVIRACESWR